MDQLQKTDIREPLYEGYVLSIHNEDENICREYRINKEIGRGGSCIVYEAHPLMDPVRGEEVTESRTVIIKECYPARSAWRRSGEGDMSLVTQDGRHPVLADDRTFNFRERFEAGFDKHSRFYQKYSDIALPRISHCGEANNTKYGVFDCHNGMTLTDLTENRQFRLDDISSLMAEICRVIGLLHRDGFVYLDIKPDNFFVVYDEKKNDQKIYLFDFGSVRRLDRPDELKGYESTPQWEAPELRDGRINNIGFASDIYSVGMLFFWFLMRRLPSESERSEFSRLQVADGYIELDDIPVLEILMNGPVLRLYSERDSKTLAVNAGLILKAFLAEKESERESSMEKAERLFNELCGLSFADDKPKIRPIAGKIDDGFEKIDDLPDRIRDNVREELRPYLSSLEKLDNMPDLLRDILREESTVWTDVSGKAKEDHHQHADDKKSGVNGARRIKGFFAAAEQKIRNSVANVNYRMGLEYLEGQNVPKDLQKARELFTEAAEDGHVEAQYHLGKMYGKGIGGEQDDKEAFKWLKKSANAGHVKSQILIAPMYYYGDGAKKDPKKAFEMYKKAADAGDAGSQCWAAFMYYRGEGVEQDYTKALKWFEKSANAGYKQAQYYMGRIYYFGQGAEEDLVKAREWFEKAAAAGVSEAQYYMGRIYYFGKGTEKDLVKAREWFEKAAAAGFSEAQYYMGRIYYFGEGTEKDPVKAKEWFEKAVAAGISKAQYYMGCIYYFGEGTEKDPVKAREWLGKAAKAEDPFAQYNYAVMLYYGEGGDRDIEQAIVFFKISAASGYAEAQRVLDRIPKDQ